MSKRKTVKFTYEGSNKFCKLIYLLGTIIAEFGNFIGLVGFFYGLYFGYRSIFILNDPDKFFNQDTLIYGLMLFAAVIVLEIIGNFIINISQLINWWDRGSVNTKITRNVRK